MSERSLSVVTDSNLPVLGAGGIHIRCLRVATASGGESRPNVGAAAFEGPPVIRGGKSVVTFYAFSFSAGVESGSRFHAILFLYRAFYSLIKQVGLAAFAGLSAV